MKKQVVNKYLFFFPRIWPSNLRIVYHFNEIYRFNRRFLVFLQNPLKKTWVIIIFYLIKEIFIRLVFVGRINFVLNLFTLFWRILWTNGWYLTIRKVLGQWLVKNIILLFVIDKLLSFRISPILPESFPYWFQTW